MSKRGRGHFCWCCDRMRPNEKFSGSGHARHLCRDCARLGQEELLFRQAQRNIDQLFGLSGGVRRKGRKALERFLAHPNEKIRRYAEERVAAGRVVDDAGPSVDEPTGDVDLPWAAMDSDDPWDFEEQVSGPEFDEEP